MEHQEIILNALISLISVFFTFYMAARHQRLLFCIVIASAVLLTYQFSQKLNYSRLDWMEYIKVMSVVLLGLGAITGFGILPGKRQESMLPWFTIYINFAVLGNIVMMVFVPADGTYRGIVSRFTCLLLVAWLILEMSRHRWATVSFDRGYFIFNSSLLPWVVCHAFYRLALLSLPTFNNVHYLLLEPLSLTIMALFYRAHGRSYPLHYYFGYADTVVVATMIFVSHQLEKSQLISQNHQVFYQPDLDFIFLPIQTMVAVVALFFILKGFLYRLTRNMNQVTVDEKNPR